MISEPPLESPATLSELAINLRWVRRKQDGVRVLISKIRHASLPDELIWIANDPPALDELCERFIRFIADMHNAAEAAGIGQPARSKDAAVTARRPRWA